MPIYEYICESCGEDFEILVMGGNQEISCPRCHGTRARRKLSTFASQGSAKGGSSCSGCSSSSCSTCR